MFFTVEEFLNDKDFAFILNNRNIEDLLFGSFTFFWLVDDKNEFIFLELSNLSLLIGLVTFCS